LKTKHNYYLGLAAATVAAVLCLTTGFELFVRFSGTGWIKVASIVVVLLGLLLLAWPGRSIRSLIPKIAAAVLVVGYVAQAGWRYPGLLKQPRPYRWQDIALFSAKVTASLVMALLILNLAARGYKSFSERRRIKSGDRV
jgi:hypothetical protein